MACRFRESAPATPGRGEERESEPRAAASCLNRDGPTGTAPRAGGDGTVAGRRSFPSSPALLQALLQATMLRSTTLPLSHDRLAGHEGPVWFALAQVAQKL